ncbi:DUF2971 domain-containing protein [Shewanella electrodiphila]|uniref:DUF2971 domain-containing protein n=1 Tax=Shewanella electrodiphila TaxID=934143 RepID=A0ABT0KS40_9GAMM|nr:DUF2971 domain-containing protein [Shewanella electrodiphila]MCL1046683.1 DUF2971 domain-containing protein [Shewanella electrodiphila]
MEYYHFTNTEYGINNLVNRRIKASTLDNLNDPFEMLGIELSNKAIRKSIKVMKSEMTKKFGILCFSKTWSNPVQWGHYADNHRGLCLGFEIKKEDLKAVEYVSKRLNSNIIKNPEFPTTLLTTKFSHWRYEKEHRTVLELSKFVKEGSLYFQGFNESLKLTKVIIGSESKLTREEVRKHLTELDNGVEIIHARAAFKDFKIVTDRSKQ